MQYLYIVRHRCKMVIGHLPQVMYSQPLVAPVLSDIDFEL